MGKNKHWRFFQHPHPVCLCVCLCRTDDCCLSDTGDIEDKGCLHPPCIFYLSLHLDQSPIHQGCLGLCDVSHFPNVRLFPASPLWLSKLISISFFSINYTAFCWVWLSHHGSITSCVLCLLFRYVTNHNMLFVEYFTFCWVAVVSNKVLV